MGSALRPLVVEREDPPALSRHPRTGLGHLGREASALAMNVERYQPHPPVHRESVDPAVQHLVRQLQSEGKEPVVVVVPNLDQRRDLSGLVFVLVLAVIFMAVIGYIGVSCARAPVITENNPSCVAVC